MPVVLLIRLQGPPDPGEWGDPDMLPIDQYTYVLALLGIVLGALMLWKAFKSEHKK